MSQFLKLISVIGLLVVACNTTAPTNPGNPNPNPGDPNPGNPSGGTIVGQALDAQGKPIAGAKIWVKPVVTTGLYETRTDAQGRYEATGLPPVGYRVIAWSEREYNGTRICIRLGHEKAEDYSPINPAKGAVRNFVLKASGRIEDMELYSDMGYFGGSVSVMSKNSIPARNASIEFTLTPTGPLLDGKTGKTLTLKPNAEGYLLDVPVGLYKVKAVSLESGKRTPINIGTNNSSLGAEATLEFKSSGSCVGSYGSGIDRAYLYWDNSDNTPTPPAPVPPAPPTPPVGETSTWDGMVEVNGGSTFFVRYIFTVDEGDPSDNESLWKGDLLECASLSTNCSKIGWAQGVRQGNNITFVSMLSESGGSFATDGSFSGDSFFGTTNAVFQGKTATVTLTRQ